MDVATARRDPGEPSLVMPVAAAACSHGRGRCDPKHGEDPKARCLYSQTKSFECLSVCLDGRPCAEPLVGEVRILFCRVVHGW